MRYFLLTISFLAIYFVSTSQSVRYISPTGSDANLGTIGSPWKTLEKGWSVLLAGDTLYVRGGTYHPTQSIILTGRNGTAANNINIFAYQFEKPIFDYTGIIGDPFLFGLRLETANFIHVRGLRFTNMTQQVGGGCYGVILRTNCSNDIIEFCESDHIGGSGFSIGDNCNNNLFLNCDAHHCSDPVSPNPYGGSNGFEETGQTTSNNNTFRYCRSWWISDDGYDGFHTTCPLIYDGCWSFWNGYIPGTFTRPAGFDGDGDGFKFGGGLPPGTTANLRTYTNCLAFENFLGGFDHNFDDNTELFQSTVYNCTAFANGRIPDGTITNASTDGFYFANRTEINTIKNNLAYKNGNGSNGNQGNINTQSVQANNSWQLLASGNVTTVADVDFQSISSAGMDGPRQADGSLPVLPFMHLANGAQEIDRGVNVGLPFNGSAPDLGCYETGGSSPPPTLTVFASATPIPCFGGTSTVTVTGSGGVPPYTGTGNFTKTAGTYTFTISDLAGTQVTTTITVTQPPAITISQSSTTITINGGTATSTVTANGGTGTFTYQLDGGTFQSSNVFTGVHAGNHTLIAKDQSNCTNTLNYTLTQPTLLVASSSATTLLCNGATSTVTVSASGGTLPYTGTGTFSRTAGTYTFTVTDGGGAQATTTITITQPTAITITQSSTVISVNGGSSTTTITASGGTGSLTYQLDGGTFQSSPVFAGVLAGNHTIVVKDGNNCTNTLNYTLTQPSVLVVSSSVTTAIPCNGQNGTITVLASGGTAPYTGAGAFIRAAGTWSFTVTDAGGASQTTTTTITQPSAILISQSSTTITINGGTSTTTVTASGGTGGLTYKLDAGSFQGSNVFAGVLAGTHTITVKDANNCTNTLTYTLTQPSALIASSSAPSISCNGGSTNVTVSASGGTPPYTGTGTFSRTAGTFTFNVTDGGGAIATTTITISQPTAIAVAVGFGAAPATVTVTASGGVGGLTYNIDGGSFQSSNIFTNVAAGNHTVIVKDANSCTVSKSFTVGASLGITAITNTILCNGGTAQITIGGTGGTPPYSGTGIYFQPAGTTTYTITDNAGATHDTTIVLTQPTPIAASVGFTVIGTNGGTSTVTVTASGGVGTLNYQIDGGSFQSGNTFSGILAGNHAIVVRDANGCTVTRNFTITQPGVLNISVAPSIILCYGNNSSVVVTATGGTPPYIGTGTFPTPAGTTTFSVTDQFGARHDTIITITQPTQITISVTTGTISVNGGNTTVTATASGGTSTLTYKLDAGSFQGTGSFSGVLAGTHTVTVKDGNNCTNTNTFSISQPGQLFVTISLGTGIACNEGTQPVTVGATGGTSPYTGTGTTSKLAGTYTISITDAFGAVADTIITITQPAALTLSVSTGTISTNGGNTTVTATGGGGTGGLQYKLDGGSYQGSGSFSGVSAGNHTVTLKDANSCTVANNFTITQPGPLQIAVSPTSITCNGGNSTVTISGSGGTSPLTITGGSPQTKTAGTYTFTVTDAFGATHDTIVTISQPTAVVIDSVITGTITVFGGTTSLVIHAVGGTGAFQFKIDASSYQSDSAFSGITGGNHTATTKDANNCTGTYNFTIPQPSGPVDYYLKRRRSKHVYKQIP